MRTRTGEWAPTACGVRRRRPARAGHAGRKAGHHRAGQGRQPGARRRPVAAHAAPGVERRQQRAGGQRAVGGDAGAPAALPGFLAALPGAERPSPARRHAAGAAPTDGAGARHAVARWCTTPRRGATFSTRRRSARPLARRRLPGAAGACRRVRRPACCRRWLRDLLPLVDATLRRAARDGLFHSYNLVDLADGRAEVAARLYPMLEGQVAMLSCGLLSLVRGVGCWTRCSPARCTRPTGAASCSTPTGACPASWSATGWTPSRPGPAGGAGLLAAGRSDLLQRRRRHGALRAGLCNRADLEAAGADLGERWSPLAAAYERVLQHHAFTGRSGTMFGYEGLGCIYWHMVAKLLLAVQERVFEAADAGGARAAGAEGALPPRARRPGLPQERRRVRRLPGRPLQPHARRGRRAAAGHDRAR
jgi:hypothetical protein